MAVDFTLTDRWDNPLTRLLVLSATYTEELNGEDTLTIECFGELSKGQRILWRDDMGVYHEHVIDSTDKTHQDGRPITKAVCVNSIVELWNDYIDDRRLGIGSPTSATAMLTAALEPTRWSVGSNMIDATGTVTFYHTSAREAIQAIQEVVGGELVTEITVNAANVTRRRVSIVSQRGDQNSAKRFTYTKDINVLSRKVDAGECISQLYVYGKGVETDSGGYGRRLTIESVNGGKKYLESATAKAQWGRPDGNGGIAHSTGVAIFEDYEDPTELKRLGQQEFSERQQPRVSYTANVVDLASMGFTYEGVALGDSVAIIDTEFDPEVRAKGRVTRITRDLMEKTATVSVGNITTDVAGILRRQAADLASLKRRGSGWDLIAASDMAYLEQLRSAINDAFATNSNYQYESFALGSLWSNVPCDEETFAPIQPLPEGITPWAMNISSAGFRIASSLNGDGTWRWTTFGTGEGFTADALIAGTIQSAAYRATGTGDHWILGANGYLEAYNSKFHDAQITGQLTTETGKLKTRVVGGVVELYYEDTLLGTLNTGYYSSGGGTPMIELKYKNGAKVMLTNSFAELQSGDYYSVVSSSSATIGKDRYRVYIGSNYLSLLHGTNSSMTFSGNTLTPTKSGTTGTAVTKTLSFWDGSSSLRTLQFVNGICVEAH